MIHKFGLNRSILEYSSLIYISISHIIETVNFIYRETYDITIYLKFIIYLLFHDQLHTKYLYIIMHNYEKIFNKNIKI